MDQLTKKQLLQYIISNASEEELLELCLQIEDRRQIQASRLKELQAFVTRNGKGAAVAKAEVTISEPAVLPLVEPVSSSAPGAVETAKRLRKQHVEAVQRHLKNGPDTLANLAAAMGVSTGKASVILRTMSERGSVKFDGRRYNL